MSCSNGYAVWFTGLPCSGKSTLAGLLHTHLKDLGRRVVVLDGDEVRERLSKGLTFSREDRIENIRRIAYVCRVITQIGGIAIVAAISPHREARGEARQYVGNFVEVYAKCDLNVCVQRDVKGMYQKAMRGEIQNFTGINDPYEEPADPELVVDTAAQAPEESLKVIIGRLHELGYL